VRTGEELKRELGDRAKAVARLLAMPDGKVLLDSLERIYLLGEPKEGDRALYAWLGARDVVLYLRSLRTEGERILKDE